MGRIVDEIIAKRTFTEKALKSAAKLLKRIDWIKFASTATKLGIGLAMGPAGIAGLTAHEVLKKAHEIDYEKLIKSKKESKEADGDETLRSNIQEFHKNFEELISETKLKKVLVFIDDLDRCSPDTIIGTLEAIKLFLFTEHTAFVIGADERLIKYAVKKRFPEVPGENLEVGRDYLEKLIQYPIRLPPLNTIELTTYINLLLASLYISSENFEIGRTSIIKRKQNNGFNFVFDQSNYKDFFSETSDEFDDAIALSSQIVPVLSIGLNGNPRQAKRFLNTLLIRMNMALAKGIKLKRRLLAKLMLLEYFKPETFATFHDIQAANEGTLPILVTLEKYALATNEEEKTKLEEQLNPAQKNLFEDKWIMDWINSEPKLTKENLQAYFYFSRDKLATTAVNLRRMTPRAQDIMQKLLSSSQAVQTNAIKEIKSLSSSEAASIFEGLTQKIRQDENDSGDGQGFKMLFELVREKQDLKSQLVSFLSEYPESGLPLTVITLTDSVFKDLDPQARLVLLTKWSSTSPNSNIAKIAKQKLK
jgi:predicted KAP-like P-loop ATPase